MKIKSDFVMREIAGEKIVVPTGDAAQMNALITLNGVAAFIWECLQEDRTAEEVKELDILSKDKVAEKLLDEILIRKNK